jgi:hypothetical protein
MKQRMLTYELLQLDIGDRSLILMPRLVSAQLDLLSARLSSLGFRVTTGSLLTAKRPGQTIHISSSGYCLSNQDPTDHVAPAIPELLAVPKQSVPATALMGTYLQTKHSAPGVAVRFTPRIESGILWTELRRADNCGLTPDEHFVLRAVLKAASGRCTLLTDFPVEGSRIKVIGRRQYYISSLTLSEASSTLRVAGRRGERNSYLPRDGIVRLASLRPFSHRQLVGISNGLGEWCYLQAEDRERSNCRRPRGSNRPR